MDWIYYILLPIAGIIIGVIASFLIFTRLKKDAVQKIKSADEDATRIYNEAIKAGENKKREMLLEAKEDGEVTRIYTMGPEATVTGFVLFTFEPDECSFICLNGEIPRAALEELIK